MSERYEVSIKVVSQQGTCKAKHKVGEKWVIGRKTPEGICTSAYHHLDHYARVLMFGGAHPWEPDPDVAMVICPDRKNPVLFEVRRLGKLVE